jgi:hypothetical protein
MSQYICGGYLISVFVIDNLVTLLRKIYAKSSAIFVRKGAIVANNLYYVLQITL